MRKTVLIDFLLGFALNFFQARKDTKAVKYVQKVIVLKQANQDVDDHMRGLADYLLGDGELDFKGLVDRVNAEVDELLARRAEEEAAAEPEEKPEEPDQGGTEGSDAPDPADDST